jgi:hypothetical protein
MVPPLLLKLSKAIEDIYDAIKFFPNTVSALTDVFDEYERRPRVKGPSKFDIVAGVALKNGDLDPSNLANIQYAYSVKGLADAFKRCNHDLGNEGVARALIETSTSVLDLGSREPSVSALQQLVTDEYDRIRNRPWHSYYPAAPEREDYQYNLPMMVPQSPYIPADFSMSPFRDLLRESEFPSEFHVADDDEDLPVPVALPVPSDDQVRSDVQSGSGPCTIPETLSGPRVALEPSPRTILEPSPRTILEPEALTELTLDPFEETPPPAPVPVQLTFEEEPLPMSFSDIQFTIDPFEEADATTPMSDAMEDAMDDEPALTKKYRTGPFSPPMIFT